MRLNFSERVMKVFQNNDVSYDELKDLMLDTYTGNLVGMTKSEANDKIRSISRQIFGLGDSSTKRDRKRAYAKYGRDFFDIIEETLDITVTTGLKENEWFNYLVNYKNLREGDENIFYNDSGKDTILSIALMGKRHHDTILQRLPQGESYEVKTDLYGAAVGADIDRFLAGNEDWIRLINAITKSNILKIQELIFAEIQNAATKLPVTEGFVDSGALNSTNKRKFNKIAQNVSVANDNADVVIVGTSIGLQEINNLIEINWIASSQKESVATNFHLGRYGKYLFVEIPQKFKPNQVGVDFYDDNELYFFATGSEGDDKLVDFVDVGETLIDEITERGEANGRIDDIMKYEAQREFGATVRVGKYFGKWTITE